jgi:hypothetical protein
MTMAEEELVAYAIKRARPKFCEVILSRFVGRIKKEAKSIEDVERIFCEIRDGNKNNGSRKPRVVS